MFGIEMRQWYKEIYGEDSVTHLGVSGGGGGGGEVGGTKESEFPPSHTSYFHFQCLLVQNDFLKSHVPTI